MQKDRIMITTKSNLFIGGNASTFEIGGIDAYTVVDYEGKPYIPASTVKGIFRRIVRDMQAEGDETANKIKGIYEKNLNQLRDMAQKNYETVETKSNDYEERKKKLTERYDNEIKKVSAEYLFGIQGFNDTPKLMINDFVLIGENKNQLFSIDTKNQIVIKDDKVESNPRTYKTVCPNVTFVGDILFYGMDDELFQAAKMILNQVFEQLNCGCYRIGNSGSRGYGLVEVKSMDEV